MRKLISVIGIFVIALGGICFPKSVQAQEQTEGQNNHERIEALYEERAMLSTDWDANRERIEEIDALVLELGVTPATQEDLAKISNSKTRMSNLSAFLGTNVTSERYTTNYNGQMLEVQVIRVMVDGTERGELYESVVVPQKRISISEATVNIFLKHIIPTGLSHIPVVGGAFGAIFDTVDIIDGINEEFNCNVTKADASAVYTATSDERWVYIKYAGSADSYQVLCYEGNEIQCTAVYTCIDTELKSDGSGVNHQPYVWVANGTIKSEDYGNDAQAIQNFYYYKNYGTAFNYSQHIRSFSVVMMGTQYSFLFLPVAFSGSNI